MNLNEKCIADMIFLLMVFMFSFHFLSACSDPGMLSFHFILNAIINDKGYEEFIDLNFRYLDLAEF